jgi:hypothetical protein
MIDDTEGPSNEITRLVPNPSIPEEALPVVPPKHPGNYSTF